jgi:hypothetical protein|tara:strand:+ start:1956 stop:2435 length:480 start_codon:yes stop_codon:yes gene_type:complete
MIKMKNNIKIIFILAVSLIVSSCGFEQINQKSNNIIYIQNFNAAGEARIAYTLKNDILLMSNNNSKNKYDAEITLQKKKKYKIKDQTGKITRYNLSVQVNLKLTNLDNERIIQKTFEKNSDYDVAAIHSDTIKNETNATKNTTQMLSSDIVNFITLSMR